MHTSGLQADTIPVFLQLWMSCITVWSTPWAQLALLTSIFHCELAAVLISIIYSKFHHLLFSKRTQQRNVCVLRTLQLLWQGPETKIVPAAILANPKPAQPTRQLSQLLTCTSRHGYMCAASLSYRRTLQNVFSNIRAFSLEFSSVGKQKSIWAWSVSSSCLLFEGLCCDIDLFGCKISSPLKEILLWKW